MTKYPRLTIAGVAGDSGKTLVSCGLTATFRKMNLKPGVFKKGPDYIDSAWLTLAAGSDCRNLDSFLFDEKSIIRSFTKNASEGVNVIEGNRGLHDGMDVRGSHGTANLAKILKSPVFIALPVVKTTRTAAAIALGLKSLDEKVRVAGVIINRVAGARHEKVVRESIETIADIPVVGAIPKIKGEILFPSRHLGLTTPAEHERAERAIANAGEIIEKYLDVDKILRIAAEAPELPTIKFDPEPSEPKRVKIGYFRDRSFSFYYPENLESLERNGAELVPINSLKAEELPEIHGLYIGGGFPETNAAELSRNANLRESVKNAAERGMPIYAECGGLMFLAESVETEKFKYPMCGVFPIEIKMNEKPQGHGYMICRVDKPNPYYEIGIEAIGHEFRYSSFERIKGDVETAFEVRRGSGAIGKRDGLIYKNVFATYLHFHSLTDPSRAKSFVETAEVFKRQ